MSNLREPSSASLARSRSGVSAITLDQLRIFVTVADLQHVTKAAEALHLAQSAVSNAVAMLETELDLRLFDRVGRNIALNQTGAAFRKQALTFLAGFDDLRSWIADHKAVDARRERLPDRRSSRTLSADKAMGG